MSGLTGALAKTLHGAIPHWQGHLPETPDHHEIHVEHAAAILADPAFREALTREVAEALHAEGFCGEFLSRCTARDHESGAAALVARLLGVAT